MIRSSGFCGRTTACLAAMACAFGLAGAVHADGVAPRGESKVVETADQRLLPVRETALNRSTDGLVLQVLPNGSRRVNLQGRFRAYSVVAIGGDGLLRMACADDQAAALALAAASAHPPAARARRVAFGPREE